MSSLLKKKKYSKNPAACADEASSLFDELFPVAPTTKTLSLSVKVDGGKEAAVETALFRKPSDPPPSTGALRTSARVRKPPKPPSPTATPMIEEEDDEDEDMPTETPPSTNNGRKTTDDVPSISPPLLLDDDTAMGDECSPPSKMRPARKRTANGNAKTALLLDELPFSSKEPSDSSGDSQGSLSEHVDSFHLSSPSKKEKVQKTEAEYDFDDEVEVISVKRVKPALSATVGPCAPSTMLRKAVSESALRSDTRKKAAVYKHCWKDDEAEIDDEGAASSASASSVHLSQPVHVSGSGTNGTVGPLNRRVPVYRQQAATTSTRTGSSDVVVKKAKDAHQCHDSGESQQHEDDYVYLFENLTKATTTKLQCLSVIGLTKKCLAAEFRQYVRAHRHTDKIFKLLHEAHTNASLALCTSCLFYLLGRDKLSMELNQTSLNLLVRLMQCTPPAPTSDLHTEYDKYSRVVWTILELWRRSANENRSSSGHSTGIQFDLRQEILSTNWLATEAMVYISARRPEDWFKRAFRFNSGLEFLVKSLVELVDNLPQFDVKCTTTLSQDTVDRLNLIERYFRILQSVSSLCEENQKYLVAHNECALLKCCTRLITRAHDDYLITAHGVNKAAESLLVASLVASTKVLMNLSHDNELCCARLGHTDSFLRLCMSFALELDEVISEDKRFDIRLLFLGLLINLVERSRRNARVLKQMKLKNPENPTSLISCSDMLVKVYLRHEAAAQAADEAFFRNFDPEAEQPEDDDNQDADDDSDDEPKKPTTTTSSTVASGGGKEMSVAEIQETVNAALENASTHMEDSLMVAYVSLLIGCIIRQEQDFAEEIRCFLPDTTFKGMTEHLQNFVEFMELTSGSAEMSGQKTMKSVIEALNKLG